VRAKYSAERAVPHLGPSVSRSWGAPHNRVQPDRRIPKHRAPAFLYLPRYILTKFVAVGALEGQDPAQRWAVFPVAEEGEFLQVVLEIIARRGKDPAPFGLVYFVEDFLQVVPRPVPR